MHHARRAVLGALPRRVESSEAGVVERKHALGAADAHGGQHLAAAVPEGLEEPTARPAAAIFRARVPGAAVIAAAALLLDAGEVVEECGELARGGLLRGAEGEGAEGEGGRKGAGRGAHV